MRRIQIFLILSLLTTALFTENIKVTQIDARRLFVSQQVTGYLSVTDGKGNPTSAFKPDELSVKDGEGNELEIQQAVLGETKVDGVSFYLLVDNSGSMYDEENGQTRIAGAKSALRDFLGKRFNQKDRIAIAQFNTLLTRIKTFEEDVASDSSVYLNKILKPEKEMAYTELYGSLEHSIGELGKFSGRKAIIVLSDGENFPYYEKTKILHPEWGSDSFSSDAVKEQAKMEGITVYAINFGPVKDKGLQDIAVQTGGTVYDPKDGDDLALVYEDIKERINSEIKVVFTPGVIDSSWETVRFSYLGSESTGTYHTPSLLGGRGTVPPLVLLAALLASIVLFTILMLLKYEKKVRTAQVELFSGGESPQSTVALQNQATVIGSAGDLTVMGNPKMKSSHATILKDSKTGQFTLVSDTAVYVNNQPTKKKNLSSGDVVQIEGSTIIFDEPTEK